MTRTVAAAASDPGDEVDQRAIQALRGGDLSALDTLYHQHAARLLQLARRLTGAESDAEDVVHDVFVELPRSIMTLSIDADVGAWLRTIVINRCIDRSRIAARRRELEPTIVAASADDSAEHEADILAADRIEAAVHGLPHGLRQVFVLRAVEGYTHPEIARRLGIRVGTSEVRYHRAIRALRIALRDLA